MLFSGYTTIIFSSVFGNTISSDAPGNLVVLGFAVLGLGVLDFAVLVTDVGAVFDVAVLAKFVELSCREPVVLPPSTSEGSESRPANTGSNPFSVRFNKTA